MEVRTVRVAFRCTQCERPRGKYSLDRRVLAALAAVKARFKLRNLS